MRLRPRGGLAFLTNRWLRQRWQVRAALWAAAAFAGLAVVGFATLAEYSLALFDNAYRHWWSPFVLAPGLGMFVVWATKRYVPGAAGSGIPQVVAAARLAALDRPIEVLLSWRVAVGRVVLWSLALALALAGIVFAVEELGGCGPGAARTRSGSRPSAG